MSQRESLFPDGERFEYRIESNRARGVDIGVATPTVFARNECILAPALFSANIPAGRHSDHVSTETDRHTLDSDTPMFPALT